MPKSSQKTTGRKGRSDTQHSTQIDFTLADYADAETVASCRMKKGATNALKHDVKRICDTSERKMCEDDVCWYDKDLSDEDCRDEEAADPGANTAVSLRSPAKKTLKRSPHQTHDDDAREYPLDFWFLIGRHISPEDVGRFACICQSSHYVVHTAQFWTHLYFRYLSLDMSVPECLQPEFINKIHGLRTRVVRSLFYTYAPFIQRLQNTVAFEDTAEQVEGSQCVLMWHHRVKNLWHFNFKFHKKSALKSGCPLTPSRVRRRGKYSLENFDTDLYDNCEEAYVVLQVVSRMFISIPHTVMGMTLYKTSVSVGHGMMNHKLKLVFTPQAGCVDRCVALAGATTISLDPVINMRVLNWWDPKYPR